MAYQAANDIGQEKASSVVVDFDRRRQGREGAVTPGAWKAPRPDEKLARACNLAIMAILMLPLLLGALALVRRLLLL